METTNFGQSRELQTIFEIAALLTREDLSLTQILQAVAEVLPKGFKYEEVCQARIHFWGECFETKGFVPGSWTLRSGGALSGASTSRCRTRPRRPQLRFTLTARHSSMQQRLLHHRMHPGRRLILI